MLSIAHRKVVNKKNTFLYHFPNQGRRFSVMPVNLKFLSIFPNIMKNLLKTAKLVPIPNSQFFKAKHPRGGWVKGGWANAIIK